MRKVNIGDKFGTLKVVSTYRELRKSGSGFKYMAGCECECGKMQSVESGNLTRTGTVKTCSDCGGYRDSILGRHGHSNHSRDKSNLQAKCYRAWQSMKRRCNNESDKRYMDYGGRGITICREWIEDYASFLNDMGLPPTAKHQIDREDNDCGYHPDNCRWVTGKVNSRNKRNNIQLEIGGVTRTLPEWAEISGIDYGTLKARIYRGIDPYLAIRNEKSGKYTYSTPSGDFASLSAVAKSFTMSISGVNGRFENASYTEWVKHERT